MNKQQQNNKHTQCFPWSMWSMAKASWWKKKNTKKKVWIVFVFDMAPDFAFSCPFFKLIYRFFSLVCRPKISMVFCCGFRSAKEVIKTFVCVIDRMIYIFRFPLENVNFFSVFFLESIKISTRFNEFHFFNGTAKALVCLNLI